MSARAVHWHEGMFLRPQHFQTAYRHALSLSHTNIQWDQHHFWGIRAIEIDEDALANYRLVVHKLHARLHDGTVVRVPEDGSLQTLDLKPALAKEPRVTVYVAVPVLNEGRANVANQPASDGPRYFVDTQNLEDENTGLGAQPIRVRHLNLRLMTSSEDLSGYSCLPIARVQKSGKADAVPELDETYIPPLLACDAWKTLFASILQAIYDRIGKKVELLANQMRTRGISFESQGQGDRQIVTQLVTLNEAYTVLGVLTSLPGVHPRQAFLELARILGQLAIFGTSRMPPELPRYDHDDLSTSFFRLKQYLDFLLNLFVEPDYKERPFVGAGLRMQVSLEPSWLESVWQLFIGVKSPLETEECIRLLTKPGELDMKIGSSESVDSTFRLGLPGMRFVHSPRPPRALPSMPGLIYFQLQRDTEQNEWQNVQRSLTLAIRLNETLIAGSIQGQQVLTIKAPNYSTTLQFTLYVLPRDA